MIEEHGCVVCWRWLKLFLKQELFSKIKANECMYEAVGITACVWGTVSEENDRCSSLAVVKMFENKIEPSLWKTEWWDRKFVLGRGRGGSSDRSCSARKQSVRMRARRDDSLKYVFWGDGTFSEESDKRFREKVSDVRQGVWENDGVLSSRTVWLDRGFVFGSGG